jgi:predicted patatin/cPLA2 family phospholipase
VTVGRLETDMEKLGALYEMGLNDAKQAIEGIKEYLNRK